MDQSAPSIRHRTLREVDSRVSGHPALRFAVATFGTWESLRNTLHDLQAGGLAIETFNCLGLQRVLAGKRLTASPDKTVGLQELAFPDSVELVGCTSGPLADCLTRRLRAGTPSLEAALSRWLIPRHAALVQQTVERGQISLWVQLFDNDDERRAYQTLLANSSNSVGVHDLIPE